MLILLYGPDTFRSRQKLKELVARYLSLHPNSLSLRRYDAKEIDFQDLRAELSSQSMFQEKKLIVLEHGFRVPSFKQQMLDAKSALEELQDTILVLWEEGEITKKDPLLELILAAGKAQYFQLLKGLRLRSWVLQKLKEQDLSITSEAIEVLVSALDSDLWRLSQEISKLAAFKKEDAERAITTKDLEQLLPHTHPATDIFSTIDAAASRDLKRGFSLLYRHLEQGDSPLYLFSMLHFQLRNIMLVKELQGKSGLHPFIIKKLTYLASNFSREKLKSLYEGLYEKDLAIKRGALDPPAALDLLLLEMASN